MVKIWVVLVLLVVQILAVDIETNGVLSLTAEVQFNQSIRINASMSSNVWIAVGYSAGGSSKMVGPPASHVVIVLPDDGTMEAYDVSGHTVGDGIDVSDPQPTFVDKSMSADGDKVVFSYTIDASEWGWDVDSDSNYLIWAYGSSGALAHHAEEGWVQINFQGSVTPSANTVDHKKLAHGWVMIIAWGFCIPAGIMSVRFFQHFTEHWFDLHRGFQITAVLLTIVGFAIAFSYVADNGGRHFDSRHQRIGLTVFVLTMLQPFNTFFRGHRGDGTMKRMVWEATHRLLGFSSWILAVYNAYFACNDFFSANDASGDALFGALTASLVVMGFVSIVLFIVVPSKKEQGYKKLADFDLESDKRGSSKSPLLEAKEQEIDDE